MSATGVNVAVAADAGVAAATTTVAVAATSAATVAIVTCGRVRRMPIQKPFSGRVQKRKEHRDADGPHRYRKVNI
ncbi:hypothetical protein GCM10009827_111790 [Dactylosporangium maewongense]|uniref:Secreted protein n=1 Tax=Dactylosporangium maewongense TaxID=634393 RepID=A0ABN2D6N2_9ACTN